MAKIENLILKMFDVATYKTCKCIHCTSVMPYLKGLLKQHGSYYPG